MNCYVYVIVRQCILYCISLKLIYILYGTFYTKMGLVDFIL